MDDVTFIREKVLPKRAAPTDMELPPTKRPPPQESTSLAFGQAELTAARVAHRIFSDKIEQLHQNNLALTWKHEQLVIQSSNERATSKRQIHDAQEHVDRLKAVLELKEHALDCQRDEIQRLQDHTADMSQQKLTLFKRIRTLRTELEAGKHIKSAAGRVEISPDEEGRVKSDLLELEDKLRVQQQSFELEKQVMQGEIVKLQETLRRKEDQDDTDLKNVQKEMERLQVRSEQRAEDLKTEIKILQNYNAELEEDRRTLESELRASQQQLSTAKATTSDLNEDLDEQKRLLKAATQAKEALARQRQDPRKESREKAELNRTVKLLTDERDGLAKKVKDMSVESFSVSVWQDAAKAHQAIAKKNTEKVREALGTQRDLEVQLQQRDAEIAELKRNPPKKSSKRAIKEAEQHAQAALEARMAAERRAHNMFQHYDVLHGKNLVLVGKLTAMAQVGGFGNHGSIYRKELDALKGIPLEELDAYKDQS